jgi:hypothetical protein
MPTLRFGKVWQVIRHFGYCFCNLGTSKTVILKFVNTVNIVTIPHIFPHMVTPTMFPVDKKTRGGKKVLVNNVLIPF